MDSTPESFSSVYHGILALILIGRAEGLIILLVAGVLKAIAQGMSQPALQTEAFRSMPYEKRGIASSTMYIGGDLGQAVGPVIAEFWRNGRDMALCLCSVRFPSLRL